MAQAKKAKTESRESQEDSRLFALVDDLMSIRLDRHISQKIIAKRIGIGQPALSAIELRKSGPNRTTAHHMERVLRELRGE